MNKYLIKIASASDLPYRDRVEVVIQKDGMILMTKNKNKDTGDEWFGFPGGGVDGQKELDACKNECLEEVGVRVSNLKNTNIVYKQEGGMSKKEDRHLKFRGSITKWYVADFDSIDKSKLGDDGDSRKYTWKTHQEALQALRRGKYMVTPRVDAIRSLKPVKSV